MIYRSTQGAHSSGRPAEFTHRREKGYVLLFALGLLAVVGTLVLSVTVTLRLDAQLLAREKAIVQEEYLLRGAAQFTAAQLSITSAVTALRPPLTKESLSTWTLWTPQGQTYNATIGSTNVMVELDDISGLPDANLLTLQEWERIFVLIGSSTPESAKLLAKKVLELREQLALTRKTGGFSSLEELLQWREISKLETRRNNEKSQLRLQDVVVVGTMNKKVDLKLTPLPLLQVLGTVTNEHLRRLATLRQSGNITPVQAQQWLQGTGLTALATDTPPTAVQARLRMASSKPNGLSLIAVIVGENGEYSVIDQRIEKGEAGS